MDEARAGADSHYRHIRAKINDKILLRRAGFFFTPKV
jgi:hypothetical protein